MGVYGIGGLLITVYPPEGSRYDSPEYDLLWGAAQELKMPLSLYLVTNRLGSGEGGGDRPGDRRFSIFPNSDFFVRVSVADMISAGVFERFPKLQVGAVEQQLGWVPFFLERMDYAYNQRGSGRQGYRFKEDMLPSDFSIAMCSWVYTRMSWA